MWNKKGTFCQTPVLGLWLEVDFNFACDNNNNNNKHNNDNDKNPHINFLKGTLLGDKDQGVGIRDKGYDLSGVRHWRPSLNWLLLLLFFY